MRTKMMLGLVLMVSGSFLFAQKTFNVKEGLWETTVTHSGSGAPGMSDDMLAKIPPDQRAQVEAMMKQRGMSMSGNTTVAKNCVTKEKIEKGMAFAQQNRGNCTHDIVKASASHMEVKMHCEEAKDDGSKTTIDANSQIDVIGTDSVKGTTHAVTSGGNHNMTMDLTFTSKYLGPACGDIK
jgi:Protein of unknown function (DUF3617)